MGIEFFDGDPHAKLAAPIRNLLADARRIDAAIAFVTAHGCELWRYLIALTTAPKTRLVASVRFPTHLQGLADISAKVPGCVWIHTGYKEPYEVAADRGQFHSKLVVADLDGDERLVIVGSHNWTRNALEGDNLEASLLIRCREHDDLVQKARQHIEACIAESRLFDPQELRFYQTVQRRLHIGPPPLPTERFPGFEDFESLVIHAEDGTNGAAPAPLRLFVPVREPGAPAFFRDGRRVQLFLYPLGTLHDRRPPTAIPSLFNGRVTMINEMSDAPVDQRLADCELTGLRCPVVKMLAGNVPSPSGESRQVVVRLDLLGEERLPVYHADPRAPNLALDVSYQTIDLNELFQGRPSRRDEESAGGEKSARRRHRRVEVPHRLFVAAVVRVASPNFYDLELKPLLRHALHGSDFINREDSPDVDVEVVRPSKKEMLNDFVYNVYYRFSKHALARAEAQMKMF